MMLPACATITPAVISTLPERLSNRSHSSRGDENEKQVQKENGSTGANRENGEFFLCLLC